MKDQLLAKIKTAVDLDAKAPPVVTLDEYFLGNTDEECIAPNQVGYGRPTLAEMYNRFKDVEQRPDVQAVRVGIHGDWVEALTVPELWPAAENIHIYTTASARQVEEWISGMESDGVIEGWPYGMHSLAPKPKPGYKVFSVCWD